MADEERNVAAELDKDGIQIEEWGYNAPEEGGQLWCRVKVPFKTPVHADWVRLAGSWGSQSGDYRCRELEPVADGIRFRCLKEQIPGFGESLQTYVPEVNAKAHEHEGKRRAIVESLMKAVQDALFFLQ